LGLHHGQPFAAALHRRHQRPSPPRSHPQTTRPGSYTERYNITRLVYFEHFQYVRSAIAREKEMKDWNRNRKLELIKNMNATWQDLSLEF
jgi:predicted GIY-YIG superfamily endonuclease